MESRETQCVNLPRFVVFEGVDGVGKSTLARALADYYRAIAPDIVLYAGAFPGSEPGTLGEWVYRLHHNRWPELSADAVAPPALQFLHVAAHIDAIRSRIAPTLTTGHVILDRYWWSTYAYARTHLSPDQACDLPPFFGPRIMRVRPSFFDLLSPSS